MTPLSSTTRRIYKQNNNFSFVIFVISLSFLSCLFTQSPHVLFNNCYLPFLFFLSEWHQNYHN